MYLYLRYISKVSSPTLQVGHRGEKVAGRNHVQRDQVAHPGAADGAADDVAEQGRGRAQGESRQDLGNLVNQLNGRRQQQHRGSGAEKL